jgi:hypothetical protein
MTTVEHRAVGWPPALLISLTSSIISASVLVVDAESSVNSVSKNRRIYHEYMGYLPMRGHRRYMLLLFMTLFTAGYLVLATSTIAVGARLFLTVAVAVLVAELACFHLVRAAAGEWWITGDTHRKGVGARILDFFVNTATWLMCHACPIWQMREPNFIGPHVLAWTIACSLLEGVSMVSTVLLLPAWSTTPAGGYGALSTHATSSELGADGTQSTGMMVARFITLPALCVALVSLALFLLLMEPRYRLADVLCARHPPRHAPPPLG